MTTVRTATHHDDLIHDAQLDYYGLKLATCSSDRLVKVFDVSSENGGAPKITFSCDLKGHTGPVWEISWAHPRWGTLLASCSYDSTVLIHRQAETGVWEEAFRYTAKASVNSIEWCPFEYGLALACADSEGFVSILRCDATTLEWKCEVSFQADKLGLNAVTWAPYGALGSLTSEGFHLLRIATGGCDNTVKIFKCEWSETEPKWDNEPEKILKKHKDWVRDVVWAPSIGLPYNLIASCSEDGTVFIWSQESENGEWLCEELENFKSPVWKVAWSATGSLLAVSTTESVTLWKESLEKGKWTRVSDVKDRSAPHTSTSATATVTAPPSILPESIKQVNIPTSTTEVVPADNSATQEETSNAAATITTSSSLEASSEQQQQQTWGEGENIRQDVHQQDEVPVQTGEGQMYAEYPQDGEYAQEEQHYDQSAAYGDQQQQQWSQEEQQQWASGEQWTEEQQQQWNEQQQQGYDPNWQQQEGGWSEQQGDQTWYGQEGQQQQWDQQQYDPSNQQQQQQQHDSQYAGEQQQWGAQQGLAAPPTHAGNLYQTHPPPQW